MHIGIFTPKLLNSHFCRLWLTALATLFSPAVHATPVQVMECFILRLQNPLPPFDVVSPAFTIRRHIEDVAPFDNITTDFWAQGKFADNGYFDLTVYPVEGAPRVVRSQTTETIMLDGYGEFGDTYVDSAPTMNKTINYDGWTVDSVSIVMKKADGTTITDHTRVPEVIDRDAWDPYGGCGQSGCPVECVVVWRAPGAGIPCAGPTGGGGICTTGSYVGRIDSFSLEEHEADHSAPFAINAGLNDAWVTAQAPYQGLFITVYADLGLVFVAWFTFETAAQEGATKTQSLQSGLPAMFGAEDQRWVTAVGAYSGNQASLNLELTTGGLFNASEPVPTQDTDYGTLDLEFSDCSNGAVTFNVPAAGLSGSFPITRVLEDNAALCEALAGN